MFKPHTVLKLERMRKRIIWIVPLALLALVLFIQLGTTMAATKTERQPYRVVKTEKEFEIRFYPATTMATITSSAKSYKELASPGFRKLAGYIFGGNQSKTSISMTAPVHMDINDTASSMSFVMPKGYSKENLPAPNDPDVKIAITQEEYVAVVRFGGYASDTEIKEQSERLKSALEAKGIPYNGHFRFLGYNAPYQFWGRRNEIIVGIDWKE